MPASEARKERREQQRIMDYSKATNSEPYFGQLTPEDQTMINRRLQVSALDDYTQAWLFDLYNLMMTRRIWTNLPLGVDARWLERCLTLYGNAVIAPAKTDLEGRQWYRAWSLVVQEKFDDQANYRKYSVQGASGGYKAGMTPDNSVIIWDNMTRQPMHAIVRQWADDLGRLDMQIAQNIAQQNAYAILYTDKENEQDAKQIIANSNTGLVGQIALKSGDDVNGQLITPGVIQTGVEPIMDKLYAAMAEKLNQIYNKLGIDYIPHEKAERMVSKEAAVGADSVNRHRYSFMAQALEACDHMNRIFNTNTSVTWNEPEEPEDDEDDTPDKTDRADTGKNQ